MAGRCVRHARLEVCHLRDRRVRGRSDEDDVPPIVSLLRDRHHVEEVHAVREEARPVVLALALRPVDHGDLCHVAALGGHSIDAATSPLGRIGRLREQDRVVRSPARCGVDRGRTNQLRRSSARIDAKQPARNEESNRSSVRRPERHACVRCARNRLRRWRSQRADPKMVPALIGRDEGDLAAIARHRQAADRLGRFEPRTRGQRDLERARGRHRRRRPKRRGESQREYGRRGDRPRGDAAGTRRRDVPTRVLAGKRSQLKQHVAHRLPAFVGISGEASGDEPIEAGRNAGTKTGRGDRIVRGGEPRPSGVEGPSDSSRRTLCGRRPSRTGRRRARRCPPVNRRPGLRVARAPCTAVCR